MTFVTKYFLFFAQLYSIDFPKYSQIFFYKIVNKIPNPLPLRIIAVINRVLIFRGLKSGNRWIFSYSVPENREILKIFNF